MLEWRRTGKEMEKAYRPTPSRDLDSLGSARPTSSRQLRFRYCFYFYFYFAWLYGICGVQQGREEAVICVQWDVQALSPIVERNSLSDEMGQLRPW